MPLQKEENKVPILIPDKMQALIDAYVKCIPISVFVMEVQIKRFWKLDLACKKVFGCLFIGFYCYDLKLKELSDKTTLVLSNTRELDRVPNTK